MKKKILAVFMAVAMTVSFTACGNSEENSENTTTQESDGDTSESSTDSDITNISQSEIEALSDNQFYVANSTGGEISELYISESGADKWGNNLLSSSISNGQKVIVSASGIETDKKYDLRIVDSDSNPIEYYNFDITSTVQVTFYENAQCDVSTI